MNLRQKIISEYQMTVLSAKVDSELKRALKYNERVPAFIDRLEREISRTPIALRDDQIAYAAKHMTLLFLSHLERAANERMMSDIEKHSQIAAAEAAKEKEKIGTAVALGKEVEFDGEQFKVRENEDGSAGETI